MLAASMPIETSTGKSSAQTPIAAYSLPAGFTIRPLMGRVASQVQAYVELHRAVFESRNMTVEWRTRTVSQPEYIADLDLVATAPDGRLAAFCIGWLDRNTEKASGQIEPLGVCAGLRHLGLGRAILSEGLSRLQLHGASQIYVETDKHRNAALELYESVGFRTLQDVLVYRKDYEST
jgi:mycothiol synthase